MTDTVIEVQDLARTYHAGDVDVHALRGVNLTIERGEFVAIMGSSGSGKSTMMAILGCLDRPTSGRYLFEGVDVAQLSDPELARIRSERIGFVFQSFNLLPRLSAQANVELPMVYAGMTLRERSRRSAELLDLVGLKDRVKHRPNELSGGEMQRVAIARSLANRPAVILADEPTGNLDSRTGADVMRLFDQLASEGNTIILVTHDQTVADHARRVIRLQDGRVAA
jgi:putative ABC transport system ATP-binding protein